MSYQDISVKTAIKNINNDNNGWFLPAIQRPYVWGSRHENELYICKLFDSILRGYPIGGLIVWNTEEEIPYREFVSDYETGDIPTLVEKGLHTRRDKWLVYDGQQRLQTLHSCLKYTFNGKILVYNLLFDLSDEHDPNETGFSFVEKNSELQWNFMRMNELFSKSKDEKIDVRRSIIGQAIDLDKDEEVLVEKNLDYLWGIYVETDKSSLAYFPIQSSKEEEVNEIFQRLNSGGMALTLSDYLFTRIKGSRDNYDFEERLQHASKDIYNHTGKGCVFGAYNVLQALHLVVKGRVRVDPNKVKDNELNEFPISWHTLKDSLHDFFLHYLWGQFRINSMSIIPRRLALLPIMIYFHEIYKKGHKYRHISSESLKSMNQYFIKSQINDWNLQTYVDNFSTIIISRSQESGDLFFDFPIKEIEAKINEKKQRNIDINEETFRNYIWFSLKILTPNRIYQFDPDMRGRFNPEIDHIFPVRLKGKSKDYQNEVNVIWNMQPIKGEINNQKSNHHPKDFFTDRILDGHGKIIYGNKYVSEFDFLPKLRNGETDFSDDAWNNPSQFIEKRKMLMINFIWETYGIKFSSNE